MFFPLHSVLATRSFLMASNVSENCLKFAQTNSAEFQLCSNFMLSIQAIMHHFSSWFWTMKLLILVVSSTLLLNTLKSCGLMFFPSDWFCEIREVALFYLCNKINSHLNICLCIHLFDLFEWLKTSFPHIWRLWFLWEISMR